MKPRGNSNGHLSVYSAPVASSEHEARVVLMRNEQDWGEAVFAIRIAPFARDVGENLDEVTDDDLTALIALGCAAQVEMEQRKSRMIQHGRLSTRKTMQALHDPVAVRPVSHRNGK